MDREARAVTMDALQNIKASLLVLFGYLIASCAAAIVGSYFTTQAVSTEFYAALSKPVWAPPGWVFAPVWTLLYITMSVAMWLVWRKRPATPSKAYTLAHAGWWGQLVLNTAWPLVFWLQPAGVASFGACIALTVAVWGCVAVMRRTSLVAAVLMIPYALWVSFATALSWALWQMNGAG